MENSAFLQASLLLASASMVAYCFTLHTVSKARIAISYALALSAFVSFLCVRWVPGLVITSLSTTFVILSISGATVGYYNFLAPETDRVKTTSNLLYGLVAFFLFVVVIWGIDNYKFQKQGKVIEHVSGKVDTIAANQAKNAAKMKNIDSKVTDLSKNDEALADTIQKAKEELYQKTGEVGDKVDNLSLKTERVNLNLQKANSGQAHAKPR